MLTIGPSSDHLHETTNSLQFGLRAMAVKVEAKISVEVDYEKLASRLQAMLDEKDKRINMLEIQVASRDADRCEMLERHRRDECDARERYEADLERLRHDGANAEAMLKLSSQYNVEIENLKEQQQEETEYQEEEHNKEMLDLIKEQTRQERMRENEVKLAQERLIAEFEKKLAEARGDSQDGLVNIVRQLADRDATLVERATTIATLEAHNQQLAAQVAELGGTPAPAPPLPAVYLDIVQVEEMRRRVNDELRLSQAQSVELKTQLDIANDACSQRARAIDEMSVRIDLLEHDLENAGLTVSRKDEAISRMRSELVDPVEVECLRVQMHSELQQLRDRNKELDARVAELSAAPSGSSASYKNYQGASRYNFKAVGCCRQHLFGVI